MIEHTLDTANAILHIKPKSSLEQAAIDTNSLPGGPNNS
jgi:hypothetical protein